MGEILITDEKSRFVAGVIEPEISSRDLPTIIVGKLTLDDIFTVVDHAQYRVPENRYQVEAIWNKMQELADKYKLKLRNDGSL